MNSLKNLHRVAEFLFLFLGTFFIITFLFFRNNFFSNESKIFLQIADLPLIFFGMIFGVTSLKLSFFEKSDISREGQVENKKEKRSILEILMFSVAIIIFLILVYVDFFVQNKNNFYN